MEKLFNVRVAITVERQAPFFVHPVLDFLFNLQYCGPKNQ